MAFSKLHNLLKKEASPFYIEGEAEPGTRCVNCRTKQRLRSFRDLKKGSHICIGGRKLMLNVGDRQVAAYTHHAIVKSVEAVSNSTAMVTLIHFHTTPYDLSIRIQTTTDLLDLFYHEVNVVQYRHPTHSPDIIIERAERLIKQNKDANYSLFSCNCEHFCNWCCVGNAKSYQADSVKNAMNRLLAGMATVGGKSFSVVSRLVLLSLGQMSKITSCCLISVPWGVIGIVTIVYLLYVIYQNFKLGEERRRGQLCVSCCRRQKLDLWIQFVAYCGLQAGGLALLSLIISAGASNGIVLGSLLVCSVLSLVCISAVPKLRKLFASPFQGKLIKMKSLEKIWIGDIVSFQQWHMSHSCVVSAVKVFPDTNNRFGEVKIIHYSKQSTFQRRQIVEEVKVINLDNDTIFSHDYSGYKVHEPEIVVNRARQRIGESKHSIMHNRSCHFCHWAKVIDESNIEQTSESNQAAGLCYLREVDPSETVSVLPTKSVHIDHTRGKKYASRCSRKMCARIRDDVEAGQLIEFKLLGLWHKAVCTEIQFDAKVMSKIHITVVHCRNFRGICEETFELDLNTVDVWIHRYHPLYRYNKETVIERARKRVTEGKCSLVNHNRLHFARDIVEKRYKSAISNIGEISPGDVICFPYYLSCTHEAIVSKVRRSSANFSGKITVIHYARGSLVSKTIREETISADLNKITKMNYDGYMTYPPYKVVERARSTIGTQRCVLFWRTSTEFVHWAKVVQYPTLVAKQPRSRSEEPVCHLLVPRAGHRVEEFQRFSVRAWSDLFPGVILEYRTNLIKVQGIITHVNEPKNEIKVIRYGSDHIFGTKTLKEETLKLDVRYDHIWVYRGHPKRCYKAEVVLVNARRKLRETEKGGDMDAWKFCKECVLKPKAAEI